VRIRHLTIPRIERPEGCASRQSFSIQAVAIDTSQQTISVRGTVNSGGESYGKIADQDPHFCQIRWPIAVKTTDETGEGAATTAQRVVKPSSKLPEAAMESWRWLRSPWRAQGGRRHSAPHTPGPSRIQVRPVAIAAIVISRAACVIELPTGQADNEDR